MGIIDRRKNWGGKSKTNHRKFIKRVEGQIKKALPKVIDKGSIKDLVTGKGKVKVPIKGIKEPKFSHDPKTGKREYVAPGNDRFYRGDSIPRPQGQGQGEGGRDGSKEGEGEDEFFVELDRDEFLKYFFENLELPDLIKNEIEESMSETYTRAGYTKNSTPSRLNVSTSVRNSLGRKIGIRSIFDKKINKLEDELKICKDEIRILEIEKEIEDNKAKRDSIPFLDDVDLRYNNFEIQQEPHTKAVMICVMDVSGSMGLHEKTIAKKFFTLLYMFLFQKYEKIEIVFIRHHSIAKEVDEDEFFNSKETGGTVVTEAFKLVSKIINERYSTNNWNIYVTQASDGDVWGITDAKDTVNILHEDIIPKIRYFAYLEIMRFSNQSSLYHEYKRLVSPSFTIQGVKHESEIWPLFEQLFKKKEKTNG